MRPLRSFILASVSLVILFMPKRAARACGFFVGPGEYRFWLLQPDLTGQYNLTPFYFASTHLYKGDMWLAKESYPVQNIKEWSKEIKGRASKAHIDSLLNATD